MTTQTAPTAATVQSAILSGMTAELVELRCTADPGQLAGYAVSGLLTPAACRESAVRVQSALAAAGTATPPGRLLLHIPPPTPGGRVPATARGTTTDLGLALAALVAQGTISEDAVAGLVVVGELGLDGSVRSTRGTLAIAERAHAAGARGVVVPAGCAWEAALVAGLAVHPVEDLGVLVAALRGEHPLPTYHGGIPAVLAATHLDMAEIRGQDAAIDALATAVADGQGVLLVGPPSTGKTMLARRATTLLPVLTRAEAVEVTRVYSALGLAQGLPADRPFRAPHHTISVAALAGCESRPGEVQLAAYGVLLLDELPEFTRSTLQQLQSALLQMPEAARPLVLASATPCPCGWAEAHSDAIGSFVRTCRCGTTAVASHQARTTQLAAILDLTARVEVPAVSLADLRGAPAGPSSAGLRARHPAAGRDRE